LHFSGSTFQALNVPLVVGANTLIATAIDLAGNTGAAAITVTGQNGGGGTQIDPVQLTATPAGGFAPLAVTLTPINGGVPGTVQQVLYDFDGDGIIDDSTHTDFTPVSHTYSAAGQYFPVVTVVTSAGKFSSSGGWNSLDPSRLSVNVQAPPVLVSTISVTDPTDLKWMPPGQLYVLSRSTATITELDVSGATPAQLRSLPNIGTTPRGLDVDSFGNVYVAINGDNRVAKYNPTTTSFQLDTTFGTGGKIGAAGSGNGQFNTPYDVAVSPDGQEITVSDSGNHRLQRFTKDGVFISAVGSQGSDFGHFNGPKGLSFAADGTLLVVDSGNSRLVELLANEVYKMFGAAGTAPGQCQAPLNVAFDARRVFVADTGNNRIQKLDHDGAPILQISSQLGLSQAAGVSLADDPVQERIYIADTGNSRVAIAILPSSDPPGGDPISVWNVAKQALVNGNIEAALAQFSIATVDSYRKLFVTVGNARVAQDMTAIGALTPISLDDDEARYFFNSTIGGQQFAFVVTFTKENGVWKIRSF